MVRQSFPLRSFRLALASAALLLAWGGAAQAGIVTTGPSPQPLASCPVNGLPGLCLVDTGAQVQGFVSDYSAVRIGRGGNGSLVIDSDASLLVNRTELAPGVPSSPNVIIGDDPGARGLLSVINGGRLTLTVPDSGNGSGGLLIGPFAAPADATGVSTAVVIGNGSAVQVDKPGGFGVAAAVGVGVGAGSNSTLVLDGGIGNFGSPALGARLDTSGNLSVGREGTGSVDLTRNAHLTADVVYLAALGAQGQATVEVNIGSTLQASTILAGIGLGAGPGGYDATNPNHGRAVISTKDTGLISGNIVLGTGGTLMGTGTLGGSVLNLGGTIKPGFSPGTLHIGGDYTDLDGHVEIEIGPGAADFIQVGGNLSLDGTSIVFSFLDGFAPGAGFSYTFLDADGSVDLQHLSYSFIGLQEGFGFTVDSTPGSGQLVFRALTDGVAVPEPGTTALLAAAAVAAAFARRRVAKPGKAGTHWSA
ncbi:MAG: PEP-CTERM sorting domain-containing protein [Pseudomonadota bacterium]|nr:PEP-CTERM sorting domain-containing protein [Pseudomonadota bacterium]